MFHVPISSRRLVKAENPSPTSGRQETSDKAISRCKQTQCGILIVIRGWFPNIPRWNFGEGICGLTFSPASGHPTTQFSFAPFHIAHRVSPSVWRHAHIQRHRLYGVECGEKKQKIKFGWLLVCVCCQACASWSPCCWTRFPCWATCWRCASSSSSSLASLACSFGRGSWGTAASWGRTSRRELPRRPRPIHASPLFGSVRSLPSSASSIKCWNVSPRGAHPD